MDFFKDSPKEEKKTSLKVSVSPPMKPMVVSISPQHIFPEYSAQSHGFELRPAEVVPQSNPSTNPPSSRNLQIPALPTNLFESYVEAPKKDSLKESQPFDGFQSFHPSAFVTKSNIPTFPDTGSSGHEAHAQEDKQKLLEPKSKPADVKQTTSKILADTDSDEDEM